MSSDISWKFSFTVTHELSRIVIFECISDNIPPQMKVLNPVIPILMPFAV